MVNSIDPAYERFLNLRSEIQAALKAKPNESDTRLKVLDRFLFEVLEWKQEAVFTEPPTASGYIDYLLTIGERRGAMVIEAKRSGLLQPPTKGDEVMHVALSGPVLKPLLPGIRQAMAYATENGVAVAALTDGNTWLFFKASRTDGKPPIGGKGVLFPSLKAVTNNFAKFVELLNVGAIIDRHHLAHLNEAEGLVITDAEQQFYVLNPSDARMRLRDSLASDAALLFAQFFSRLSNEKDREMLRDCFVETGESRKADFDLEKIIQRVLNNITALETGQGGALQAELERAMTSRRSETVLLIGNKGAGKSTFIDRFFEQVLPRRLREKCVVARVDLENYHGDPKAVVGWAILQLRSHLEAAVCTNNPPFYDELMGIVFSEYQRWSVGSRKHLYESNKTEFKDEFGRHMEERREKHADEYVRLLLDWAVRGHQKLPCLIFDNTDQFQPEIQDLVYQMAHSYESAAPVFNVVPITDRTVWRLSKAGALQSYSARSFYLPVPDTKEIISRRVEFLKLKVQAEPTAAKSYFSKRGFQVEVNDLAILADAVGKVFVDSDYVSGFIGRQL
jgi:predicted type IV restriction endonuclease